MEKKTNCAHSPVDLNTLKLLIIHFHKSNVRKSACYAIFVQFQKMVEKRFKLTFAAV